MIPAHQVALITSGCVPSSLKKCVRLHTHSSSAAPDGSRELQLEYKPNKVSCHGLQLRSLWRIPTAAVVRAYSCDHPYGESLLQL